MKFPRFHCSISVTRVGMEQQSTIPRSSKILYFYPVGGKGRKPIPTDLVSFLLFEYFWRTVTIYQQDRLFYSRYAISSALLKLYRTIADFSLDMFLRISYRVYLVTKLMFSSFLIALASLRRESHISCWYSSTYLLLLGNVRFVCTTIVWSDWSLASCPTISTLTKL